MLGVVQSALLLVGADAQWNDSVHNKIEGIAESEDPNDNAHQGDEMSNEDGCIAVNQPHFFGKNAGEHHAHQTADAVTREDIERVVDGEARLETNGPIADE